MSLSAEVIVSVVFGIVASIVAVAAVAQAALYFARIHHSKLGQITPLSVQNAR